MRSMKDFMSMTQEELDAERALRQHHERIGRLVVENVEALRKLYSDEPWNCESPLDKKDWQPTMEALASILKEVEL